MNVTVRKITRISLSLLSIIGYGFFVFAAAPTGGYVPGQTNNPNCAPNDTDCLVRTGWVIDPINGFVTNTTDKIGIGTNTPLFDLAVNGEFQIGSTAAGSMFAIDDAAALGFPLPPSTSIIGTTSNAGISGSFYNVYMGVPGGMYDLGISNGDFQHDFNISGNNDGFEFKSIENSLLADYDTTFNIRTQNISMSSQDGNLGTSAYFSFGATGDINLSANASNPGDGGSVYVESDQVGLAFHTQSTNNDGNGTPVVLQVYDENQRGGGFSARSRNLSYANAGADMYVWDQALGGDRTYLWLDESKIDSGLFLDQYVSGMRNYTTNNVSEMSFEFHNSDSSDPSMNSKYLIAKDFSWIKPTGLGTLMNLDGSSGNLGIFGDMLINGDNLGINGVTYTFPSAQGAAATALVNDGTGILSWAAPMALIGRTSGVVSNPTGTGTQETWLGQDAGANTASREYTVFVGMNAGDGATNVIGSNFIGHLTGTNAINASQSNFFGTETGSGATGASQSNFFGYRSGLNATGAHHSNFMGLYSGYGATSAYEANFLGYAAGYNATAANNSIFMGTGAGNTASTASDSIFVGANSGYHATNANNSNFIGTSAGYGATGAMFSNFIGVHAGELAINASDSNFIGDYAGYGATNSTNSNFIGVSAGTSAVNAKNSIFIGYQSGNNDTVNNTLSADDFSILIGKNTSTGGFSNSIAIGDSATNTASNQLMVGSSNRPINDLVITGTGFTTCSVNTGTGAGISCSSDQRLKKNVTDLGSNVLDSITKLKTVSFNWISGADTDTHIGFLAQDIQQYYPELVSTAPNGYLQVNYAGITPVLVEAIRELNIKMTDIQKVADAVDPTFLSNLKSWLGSVTNKLTRIHVDQEICIGATCINESELNQFKHWQVSTGYGYGYGMGTQ